MMNNQNKLLCRTLVKVKGILFDIKADFFFLCEDEKIIKNKEVQREKENDKVILSSLRDLEK